jgi:hypothetical protein
MQRETNPATCPVAELGRQAAVLFDAYTATEKTELTLKEGPERSRLERLGEHIEDHRLALEACAAGMQAQSVQGALYQVLLAYAEAYSLRDMAALKEADDAEKAIRRVSGLLYSAVRVLEQVSGIPADELGMEHYMHRRYDPHPALKASLAGEPISPAPDADE